MKVLEYLLLVVLNKIAVHEALHFKIYVPDVVNHHFHTKTVLVHVHKPAPKKPHKHKHEYHENWSSWKSYDHSFKDDYGKQEFPEEQEEDPKKPVDHKDRRQKHPAGRFKDHFPQHVEDNHLEQMDRQRGKDPAYAVHEDVNEIPPNTESFVYNYEEGYKKGLQEETGHIRSDQTKKFHEDHHEEQDETGGEGSRDEYEGKTDAGRYFVDDVEYESTRDKREGKGGRFRRVSRV